jgi:hypothetical protein
MKFDQLEKIVIPTQAGIQLMGNHLRTPDSRFHETPFAPRSSA